MNNNNNTNSTIDEELIGKPYKGPTKLVWEDGRQIRKPDLSSTFSTTTTNNIREFKYQKTLQDSVSKSDETRFSQLKDDESKYQFISNM
jgi:hypothetical protein